MKSITNTDNGKIISIQSTSTLTQISENQLANFEKYKSAYKFPYLINRSTDCNVRAAKKANSNLARKVKS